MLTGFGGHVWLGGLRRHISVVEQVSKSSHTFEGGLLEEAEYLMKPNTGRTQASFRVIRRLLGQGRAGDSIRLYDTQLY